MTTHGRNHWIKLYVEMNHDPKIGLLTDDLKWRFTSILLLAGELGSDGFLPPVEEMAWTLRTSPETLAGQMRTLAGRELVELRVHPEGGERWFVTKFSERQAPSTNAERQKLWRERNSPITPVTKRNARVTPETETETEAEAETEAEGEKNVRAQAQVQPAAGSPPPIVVTHHIPDRTPNGNGYHPPEEPPEPAPAPADEERRQAIGAMANAITDVTGISAKLNKAEVVPLAIELVDAGYSPGQLLAHYGKDAPPVGWHWYRDDWRGVTNERRKGGPPRLKEIRETIVLATASSSAAPVKKLGAVDRALAMFGNAPKTAPA